MNFPKLICAFTSGARSHYTILGHYLARALPSAGVLPWVKSLVCDLQNPCFQTEVPSEIPGQINDQATLNTSSIE